MAQSLLDVIRTKLQPQAPAPAVTLGQGEQTANLLRTKLTGSAQPQGGDVPKRSMIGEQAAATQTQAQLGQVAKESQIQQEQQNQQQADQNQGMDIFRQQNKQEDTQRANQFANQMANVLNDFKSGNKRIQNMQDIGEIEAAGAGARLANNQYIDNLTRTAAMSSLDNDTKFQEEYYKNVFADDFGMFKDKMDWANLINADERQFLQAMGNLDINDAIAIARGQATAANTAAAASGAQTAVSGGLEYYDSAEKKKANEDAAAKAEEERQLRMDALRQQSKQGGNP